MSDRFWLLGASDHEMTAIEELLGVGCGEEYAYATIGGRRVHAGNAWRSEGCSRPIPPGIPVVLVECRVSGVDGTICDHHAPGDPGYGIEPAGYWLGSSLGQVCALLGVEPTPHLRRVAAADHCLGAAYRGECPGVDPEELLASRVRSKAEYRRVPAQVVIEEIRLTQAALSEAPITASGLRDMRGCVWPEMPEAALSLGFGYIAGPIPCPDGRRKIVCSGTASQVESFMRDAAWLVGVYGDPVRGFAGGYLP